MNVDMQFKTPISAPTRIHHMLDLWIREQPQAPALRDAKIRLSYSQLDEASRAAAEQLKSLGVRAGDRVLVVGENCVALGVLAIALSHLDAWVILANARLSDREIDEFISHARPRRVLYTEQVSADASRHAMRHGAQAVSWEALGNIAVGPLDTETVPEPAFVEPTRQVAAMIYTSGTSGAPKGVMLSHANLMFTATSIVKQRSITPGDVSYCVLPMAHVVGLAAQFLGSMAGGAEVIFEPRFSPANAARALAEDGVTAFAGVPALYAKLLEWLRESGATWRAPRLRLITVAGAPLTSNLKTDVEALFGLPLHNGYGLTECAPTVAQTRSDPVRTDCAVGQPIPGVDIRIVNAQGTDVNGGDIGELWVQSPGLMLGYYHNDAATQQAINADGWFNTGDLARQESDGALHIVGRTKELIIRSGLNVYPVEVEQAINSHPEVVQSAVVGRSVEANEEVVAFIEPTANSTLDAAGMKNYLRERLAAYKVPSDIRFLVQLPSSPTGKVLKGVLKVSAQEVDPLVSDAV
jgi:acyl-CoA synthetase (AMP-forming)/AMP-acid ligase II